MQFPPGATAVEITGGIARGERDCLSLNARAGQLASLSVQGIEGNAVLQFYRPGWKISQSDDAIDISGTAYPGATEGDGATRWSGRLAGSGAQLIVIGSTRGGASYRLRLSVAP